ncbi:MAG: beta strand repeat-containing protein, partial [Isosphaeraceae bacterium]
MGVRPTRAYIQKAQVSRRRRFRRVVALPAIEALEDRRLLATVYWSSTSGGDWSTKGDWSTGQVPGPGDDVVINVNGATPTITLSEGDAFSVHSLTAADPLDLVGGSLTVTGNPAAGGDSTITGDLTIQGGTLIASGSSTNLQVSGAVTADSGEVSATGGASFSLPGLTSFAGTGMTFSADGPGSKLDITGITSFGGSGTNISETNSGHVAMDTSFTKLGGVSFTIDGTSDLATSLIGNLTALTDGGLDVLGGTYAFPNLTDIDGSSLQVSGGASLTLRGVASYTDNSVSNPGFLATDTTNGGTLSLPALATIGGNNGLQVEAAGAKSTIDLSSLTTFSALYSFAALSDTQSATIDESKLTSLTGVIVTIDGTGVMAISQWTSYNDGSLSVNSGNYSPTSSAKNSHNSFTNLSNIDGSSLYVFGGGTLTLPAVKTYNPGFRTGEFDASGTGAVLNLPALTSVSRPKTSQSSNQGSSSSSGYYARNRFNFKASGGGQVQATALASIQAGATRLSAGVQVQGTGSLVDLSSLATFASYNAVLSATQGGTITLGAGLTSLESTIITADGTGGIITPTDSSSLDNFRTLNYDYVSIKGGTYALPNLTNINNTGLSVSGGGNLTLAGVTSWLNSQYSTGIYVSIDDTTSGGTLNLPNVTKLGGHYGFIINVSGSSSALDVPRLTALSSPLASYHTPSSLEVAQGGMVEDTALTQLKGVTVKIHGKVHMATRQWKSLTDGELSVTGTNYPSPTTGTSTASFAGLTDIRGTGIFVSGGQLTLPGVTSFNPRNTRGDSLMFEASGSGAVLSLPKLTSVTGSSSGPVNTGTGSGTGGGSGVGAAGYVYLYGSLNFDAANGGTVEAKSLSSITAGANYVSVGVLSTGASSLVDLSALTTYEGDYGQVKASGGGRIDLTALTTI